MMPDAAIAFACRSAIAVSCGSVLTADRPCSRRYCEIASAISSACAKVAVMARITPSETAFIHSPVFPAMKKKVIGPGEGEYEAWHEAGLAAFVISPTWLGCEQDLDVSKGAPASPFKAPEPPYGPAGASSCGTGNWVCPAALVCEKSSHFRL